MDVIKKEYDLYINMYIYIYTSIHVFFCLYIYIDAVLKTPLLVGRVGQALAFCMVV